MSGEGECLYYWVQNGLDSIRHEEEWVAEQQAKLEAAREALLVRCGWTRHPEGHLRAMWSRGAFRHVTTVRPVRGESRDAHVKCAASQEIDGGGK